MPVLNTNRGSKVEFDGETMKVVGTKDFDHVILQRKSGEYVEASVQDLLQEPALAKARPRKFDARREEKVPAYWAALGEIALGKVRGVAAVQSAADKLGISLSAAYKALQRYNVSGLAADLPPPTRNGGRGKSRLNPKIEAVIAEHTERLLLTRRNFPPDQFYREVNSALRKRRLEVSQSTLRKRLERIKKSYAWTRTRAGYTEAKRTEDPLRDYAPDGLFPLDRVQMDHWQTDLEILSDDRLHVIGRPWLTLAIDTYTRVIYSFHLGLDAPSTTTAGLAMIKGMTRKEGMIQLYGSTMLWPVWGKPLTLALDNAGEFRGRSMIMSADHFGIELDWRPVDHPQYGCHIERLNGNFATRFKNLPGATGSNPKERKAFRPEVTAKFTLEDLVKHMLMLIDEYHNTVHLGIGCTPLERYRNYFFGPDGPKRRLPKIYTDDLDLRVNWYPLCYRSIQRYGIRIDYLDYYSEELEQLVRNRKGLGRIAVRRNPFDVREIYFLHPTTKEWRVVPTRHINFPIASLYELQAAKKKALRDKRQPTPALLAAIINAQREHIVDCTKLTRSAARNKTRKSHHDRIREHAPAPSLSPLITASPATAAKSPTQPPGQSAWTAPTPEAANENLADLLAGLTDDDIDANLNRG
jgi:putative transposase